MEWRMTRARYAIYYAPPEGSALEEFGRRWFGSDSRIGGHDCGLPGFSRERLNVLTAASRAYGFHATLKAPFQLHPAIDPAELRAAMEAFAERWAAAPAPPLRVGAIHGFLALMPSGPAPAVDRLAADCVRAFEPFRAPPTHAEAARRRAASLSLAQSALFVRWGYPYVMEQFRFHLTLTDRIADAAERMAVLQRILPLVVPFRSAPLNIDQVSLCRQDQPGQAFVIEERYPLREAPC
jgi:putative phosphonate metabolism protein